MDYISLNSSSHSSNLVDSLDHFKALNSFVDVTLVCEGHTLKAHKIILSAGSNVLHRLLIANPAKHPIIILAETKYDTLRLIIDFLYKGKIEVPRNDLKKLLSVATTFEINELKRLCERNLIHEKTDAHSHSHSKPYDLRESSPKKRQQRRQSSDSDIVLDAILLKQEISSSPCSSDEPEVSSQTDCGAFQPQIADTRSLSKIFAESSTGSDSTAAYIQNTQRDASSECDIQPLKELESNLVRIEHATIVVRSKYNEKSDDSELDTQKKMVFGKRKRSKIWAFYNAVDATYAKCKICGRKLSYKTTVSNLKKHLLSKHRKFDPKNPPKLPDLPLTRIEHDDLELFEEIDFSSIEEAAEQDGESIECEEVIDEDIPSTSNPCILKIT